MEIEKKLPSVLFCTKATVSRSGVFVREADVLPPPPNTFAMTPAVK
jgi:hypothetical protein